MKSFFSIFIILFLISISACRKDFSTIPSVGELQFSKDTVFLDTIFTNIGSATYDLKIYNRGNNDISIPNIQLERGDDSHYRLNVDGIAGKSFENIEILAKDSLFLFIETTVDSNKLTTSPLYTDRILFDTGEHQQNVDLVTLVEDAQFIFPERDAISMKIDSLSLDGKPTIIEGRFLKDGELTFTNIRPIVIYGYAAVPAGKILTIDAGAKVYFHHNSGLIVDKNASLKINGTATEKVVFEGDRLDHSFSNVAGQWGTIWLRAGSKENEINHAQIKNGGIGILVDSIPDISVPTLKIRNTEIYNHTNYGILARKTSIEGSNLVVGNAGKSSLSITAGGKYNFTHSTFANYWSKGLRQSPSVYVSDYYDYKDSENNNEIVRVFGSLKTANFTNCIFEGNNNIEFFLDKKLGGTMFFNYNIKNCLIRFNDTNNTLLENTELDFTDTTHYLENIFNEEPHFKDTSLNDFRIGENNSGINKGNMDAANSFPFDILEVNRTTAPDIGAYQHITFE